MTMHLPDAEVRPADDSAHPQSGGLAGKRLAAGTH
jgi:hypothetical protein